MTKSRLANRVIVLHHETRPLKEIVKILKRDYHVEEYHDADIAARAAMGGWLRAVFADVNLSEYSALRLLKRLPRKNYGRPPVLLLGPRNDPRLKIAEMQQLADKIIEWPCPNGKLIGAIWRLLDQSLETLWEELPPIQKQLLDDTRQALNSTIMNVARGKEVNWELVARSSETMVQATKSGDMSALLQSLRASNQLQYVHAVRVATNMTLFGASIGVSKGELNILAQAGLLHDLGMSLLPQELTNKPEELSPAEFAKIKKHPLISKKLLGTIDNIPQEVLLAATHHHESLDGDGYPDGISGTSIDNVSLICAMSDAHAALTSKRPHRAALTQAQAFELMWQQAGTRFDPAYLRRFEELIRSQNY